MTTPTTIRLNHTSVNFVYITDPHISERPPGKRTGAYMEQILGKISFAAKLAHEVKGVGLCGGDVFHNKYPRSEANTFHMVGRTAQVSREFPFEKLWGAVGNHDLYMDRADSLPFQPLGALIGSGVYHDLTADPVIFENADATVRVLVEAYMYAEEEITLQRVLNAAPRPEGVTYRVGILHAYANPGNAGEMFGHPTIGYHQLAESDYDLLLWGHDHSREKTTTDGNTTHIRLGSLSRASLAEDEVNRPVSVAVLSFKTDGNVSIQEKEIPVQPLEIAFTNANVQVVKVDKRDDVTKFLSDMKAVLGSSDGDVGGEDPRGTLSELCPDEEPDLLALALELCGW